MLAVVGLENSRRVLLAIASNSGVKLLIWLSSNSRVRTFLRLALAFLSSTSDHPSSLSKDQNRSYITLHKIYK
jgi:hypothetical protein